MQRQQMKEVMERAEVMQKGWDQVCEQEPKFESMRQRCKVAAPGSTMPGAGALIPAASAADATARARIRST